ncbi:hypothetical protein [Teredinibacter waterburyi]|uniref:hypothetical protein n=1 Tax=Teredinibacter waterburyi TaxID=1500538 RepID=UPI00165EDAB0|nr:hypothetical protein [Teredinibacter waterburyi]
MQNKVANQLYRKTQMKNLVLSVIIVLLCSACGESERKFEMTVDKVEVLKGLILKGLALSGAVSQGCIQNGETYTIYRDGKVLRQETARILLIGNLKDGESFDGKADKSDYASFYIPDGNEGDVMLGDVFVGEAITCGEI